MTLILKPLQFKMGCTYNLRSGEYKAIIVSIDHHPLYPILTQLFNKAGPVSLNISYTLEGKRFHGTPNPDKYDLVPGEI